MQLATHTLHLQRKLVVSKPIGYFSHVGWFGFFAVSSHAQFLEKHHHLYHLQSNNND